MYRGSHIATWTMRRCYAPALSASISRSQGGVPRGQLWLGVFSTGFPHENSRFPHALETLLALGFAEESYRRTLWDNTARYYGFH